MTLDANLYDIRQRLDAEGLNVIADTTNNKYNAASWKNFCSWGQKLLDREFSTMFTSNGIVQMAAVLAHAAKKPLIEAELGETYRGTIPVIGLANSVTGRDILNANKLNGINSLIPEDQLFDLVSIRLDELLYGTHRLLTNFTYQLMSTAKIVLAGDKDSKSMAVSFVNLIPAENFRKVAKLFSDPTSDKVQALIDLIKYCEDNNIPCDYLLMDISLRNMIVSDPNTISRLVVTANPTVTPSNISSMIISPSDVLSGLETKIGKRLVAIDDNKFKLNIDGVPEYVEAFDKDMIAVGQFTSNYEMANSISEQTLITTPTAIRSSVEDGRIAILEQFSDDPVENKFSVECWAMPYIKNPNYFVTLNTAEIA